MLPSLCSPCHRIHCLLGRHPTRATPPKKPIGSSMLTFNPSSTRRWVPPSWPRLERSRVHPKAQRYQGVFGLDLKTSTATAYGSAKRTKASSSPKAESILRNRRFCGLNENACSERRQVLVFFQKRRLCSLGPDSILAASNLKLLGPGLEVLSGKSRVRKTTP